MLQELTIVLSLKKKGDTGKFSLDGAEIETVIVVPMAAVSKFAGVMEIVAPLVFRVFRNFSAVNLTRPGELFGSRPVRTAS